MSELPSIKIKFLTATGDFDEDEYVLKSDAEAALKEKDAEIVALKKRVRELEHAVPCDSCVHIYDTPNAAGSIAACKKCHDGSGWEVRG